MEIFDKEYKSYYRAFDIPVELDCFLNRRSHVAYVLGEYQLPFLFAYLVYFSDGHEVVLIEMAGGYWAEQGPNQAHAKSVNQLLSDFHATYLANK